jgi:hypothetical protein
VNNRRFLFTRTPRYIQLRLWHIQLCAGRCCHFSGIVLSLGMLMKANEERAFRWSWAAERRTA